MRNVPARDVPAEEEPDTPQHRGKPQLRHCLRCSVVFHSEWAGERICARCKGTTAWRRGLPVRSF